MHERFITQENIMAGTSSTVIVCCVDDSYFSLLFDSEDEIFPISDEKYAELLQLQEALMSSVTASMIMSHTHEMSSSKLKEQVVVETTEGESSQFFCDICMEGKAREEMFRNNDCSHSFCSDCICHHVAAKIQENITSITCPDVNCGKVFEPHECQSIVPKQVFERWVDAICESLILASHNIYCPFKDCSAVLVDDGGEVVTMSECPSCRRLFCAQCKVVWHSGVSCEEYQRLNANERGREDLMLMELAKKKHWRRCPRCKYFVEKNEGCLHITCRCKFEFCYQCGSKWISEHSCMATLMLWRKCLATFFLWVALKLKVRKKINLKLHVLFVFFIIAFAKIDCLFI